MMCPTRAHIEVRAFDRRVHPDSATWFILSGLVTMDGSRLQFTLEAMLPYAIVAVSDPVLGSVSMPGDGLLYAKPLQLGVCKPLCS